MKLENYYSVSEFRKLDIKSMKSLLKNSYKKDYQCKKETLNNLAIKEISNDTLEMLFIITAIEKHIDNDLDYYNSSMMNDLYYIYLSSKKYNENVYELIYKIYKENSIHICCTKQSDITLLLINVTRILKEKEVVNDTL